MNYIILNKKEKYKYRDYIELQCLDCQDIKKIRYDHFLNNEIKCKSCIQKYIDNLSDRFITSTYKNAKTKIHLICKNCGFNWNVLMSNLRRSSNCPECEKVLNKEKFNKLKSDDFEYGEFKYSQSKMKIKCKKCNNSFLQSPYDNIIRKFGCPYCNFSKGEKKIENYLTNNDIIYESQKKFEDLRDKSLLSYDFYIPEKNLLIEYNGQQHYYNSFNKPTREFHKQKHHDWLKRKYAIKNGITLLVIPYWEINNIDKILKERLS